MPDPEQLATEMAWLRSVARALLGHGDGADDLAQDASVIALEHPPNVVAGRRGWLATVLRRRAATLAKRNARRRAREVAVASGNSSCAPDTSDLCARIEMQRHLATEVLALPEPLRAVIILRFFDGLPPRRMAERLDVSVETVKSRLGRGLWQLRGRLERRFGGVAPMRSALLPLASAPSLGLAAAGSLLLPTIVMKKQLVLAAVLVAVGTGVSLTFLPARHTPATGGVTNGDAMIAPKVVSDDGTGSIEFRRDAMPAAPRAVDGSLRIQVVDPSGQPVAGVPVRIHVRISNSFASHRVLRSGTTEGSRGMVTIPLPLPWSEGETTATVFADIHAKHPPKLSLRRDAMSTGTLRLVLPPTGEVIVKFQHVSGRLLDVNNKLQLLFAGPAAKEPGVVMDGARLKSRFDSWIETVGGTARVRYVETGLALRVRAQLCVLDLAFDKRFTDHDFAGPTQPGETVTCRIESEYPVLRGRLLQPDGTPLARTLVQLSLLRRTGRSSRNGGADALRTDADGVFCIPAGWHAQPETNGGRTVPVRRDLFFARREVPVGPKRPLAAGTNVAHVVLPDIAPVGLHELGDIQLAPVGIVVAGRVVDGSGRGVPDVRVFVRGPALGAPTAPSTEMGHAVGLFGGRETDGVGRFAIPGICVTDRFRITATKAGWLPAFLDLSVGDGDGVTLRMIRGARLEGVLRIDPGVPPASLTVRLRREQGPRLYANLNEEGEFQFMDLPPGNYNAQVTLDGAEVARVSDIAIRGSTDRRDPRLDPLDLRGKIVVVALELADSGGQPLAEQSVRIAAAKPGANTGWGFRGQTDADGRCTYYGVPRAGEWQLRVRGYLRRTVALTGATQRFALKKTLDLIVNLSAATPKTADSRFYVAELSRVDQGKDVGVAPPWTGTGRFHENRGFTFHLPAPGRYRLTWQVGAMRGADGINGWRTPIQLPTPGLGGEEFEVHTTRRIEVRLDTVQLVLAFGELERRRTELLQRTRSGKVEPKEPAGRARKR